MIVVRGRVVSRFPFGRWHRGRHFQSFHGACSQTCIIARGSSMSFRRRAAAVAPVLFVYCLVWGCSPTNEEGLQGSSKAVPHKEGTPEFKSYSEAMQYQAQQNAKSHPAKGTGKKAR